jgi:[ribosomal protein S5]-alanine N-acetyltransferase
MLTTRRLFLMPATQRILQATVDQNWAKLSDLLGGVSIADGWSHFPEAFEWMCSYLEDHPTDTEWWCYFIIHGLDGRLVGSCGYKGAPDPDGMVEIGYEVAPRYQGKGVATEAAEALIAHAKKHPQVRAITATTLAEENASVQVLRRLGFNFAGEKIDAADGAVWSWRLEVSSDYIA